MYDSFSLDMSAPQAAVWFGLILGLAFGALAQRSRFCLRRGLVGAGTERSAALGVWMTALAVAIAGTQGAVMLGWVDFSDHRFLSSDLPVVAISLGGLMFGAGMVLTRGCPSRLAVLGASGNLRAIMVLIVFAVVAHATLKGVLAPLRVTLSQTTLPLGEVTTLSALPGRPQVWSILLIMAAIGLAWRSGASGAALTMGGAIGLLVPLGWVGTGYLLYDDFDPIALESLSMTSPSSEGLFWIIASSAIAPTFGTALVGGILTGAFVAAFLSREIRWSTFETPAQTGRYAVGAAMMGTGGVLAGGCTLGAGLSGLPTLSLAAILAFGAIVVGARAADALITRNQGAALTVPAQ